MQVLGRRLPQPDHGNTLCRWRGLRGNLKPCIGSSKLGALSTNIEPAAAHQSSSWFRLQHDSSHKLQVFIKMILTTLQEQDPVTDNTTHHSSWSQRRDGGSDGGGSSKRRISGDHSHNSRKTRDRRRRENVATLRMAEQNSG